MSYAPIMVLARRVLLDALDALAAHREALVLVGAQAIYLYTGAADVPIATSTKDSDLAVLPAALPSDPLLNTAMESAGFHRDLQGLQGQWLSPEGVPVELLVPAGLEPSGKRGARIPPHDERAALRVEGLEAAAVDHRMLEIAALAPDDPRVVEVNVAGPAALVVAKAHKLGERLVDVELGRKDRTQAKDAHDVYRLLRAVPADDVPTGFRMLLQDEVSAGSTRSAVEYLRRFAGDLDAPICVLAGRAEAQVGDPEQVSRDLYLLLEEALDGL